MTEELDQNPVQLNQNPVYKYPMVLIYSLLKTTVSSYKIRTFTATITKQEVRQK